MQKLFSQKKAVISFFIILGIASVFLLFNLKFSFDFSQFFPEGDEDLAFYQDFIKDFGTDDNFLLVAVENEETVFSKDFLNRFHKLSREAKELPYVTENQSLTTLFYPIKSPLGYTRIPVIRRNDTLKYEADWKKIKEDDLFINSLIDEKGKSLVLALETEDSLNYEQCSELLTEVRARLDAEGFTNYHLLGRAFFYEALIDMQKRELMVTTIASSLLIFLILFLVYRRITIIALTLSSIFLALLIFMGLLSLLGIELTVLAAFYPILLLIVGTSDVIHIMDDYLNKLKKGIEEETAMRLTLKEVGVSTLLTSVTTAIGFASLLTSKSTSVSGFGLNASIGVLTTFVTIIFFTCALLLLIDKKHLLPKKQDSQIWSKSLVATNSFTKSYPRSILLGSLIFGVFCIFGMTKINTNYQIKNSFPVNSDIANDFEFFQKNYAGFRPLEIAITTKGDHKITDFAIAQEIEKVVEKMKSFPEIRNVQSVNMLFKGLNKANNLNKSDFFVLPETEVKFESYKAEAKKLARKQLEKFVNTKETKSRISSKVLDVGLDSITRVYNDLKTFLRTEIDSSMVQFRLTGTGILLDKNSFYVRESLVNGLLMGALLVALIMALLFRDLKLLLISLLPNVLPLLFAAGLLGYLGIPLEATISVVFAIVFGIAVDDTIHFLGRYKVSRNNGLTKEEALTVTFNETGRALVITTLSLFFGFMVLLFSIHAPSVTIGLLVSVTLLAALVLDLLLLPVLIRKLL
ncbi:efflux RND transporter permease subunit [Maribacter sp. 2308TA10-17]|uniref:efflux RND transporter permease subunit n=1 Tax=Maribacter sp. 2308TA10-17 TaxID=3386276 RepID=UPI0039BC6909